MSGLLRTKVPAEYESHSFRERLSIPTFRDVIYKDLCKCLLRLWVELQTKHDICQTKWQSKVEVGQKLHTLTVN